MREKFEMLLDRDEEIMWVNNVNIKPCVLKGLIPSIVFGIFMSIFMTPFLYLFMFSNTLIESKTFQPILILSISAIIMIGNLILIYLSAKNTYIAITNKRIIKRSGAFNNSFIHYTLKNVGTIQVSGSIVDSNNSATLLITTKDFHNDNRGNIKSVRLRITSLYNAYEAYKVLNSLTEGNNENLRIKIEN